MKLDDVIGVGTIFILVTLLIVFLSVDHFGFLNFILIVSSIFIYFLFWVEYIVKLEEMQSRSVRKHEKRKK